MSPTVREAGSRTVRLAGLRDVSIGATWCDLGDEVWAGLTPRHPFESRAWLTHTGAVSSLVLNGEDRRGRAGAIGLIDPASTTLPLHTPADIYIGRTGRRLAGEAAGVAAAPSPAEFSRVFTAMSPYAYRSCVPGTLDLDATAELVDTALQLTRDRGGQAIAFPYLRDEDHVLIAALRRLGARTTVIGAGCRVEVRGESSRDHFAGHGNGARRAYRRFEALMATGAVRVRVLGPAEPLPAHIADQVVDLLAADARRHGIGQPPLELYRIVVTSWPGPRTVQWTENDGLVGGCEIGFVHNDELIAKLGGHLHRDGGYLDLGLTGSVDLAHRMGLRAADLGASTHEPKLARGGALYWIYGAVLGAAEGFGEALAAWEDRYQDGLVERLRRMAGPALPLGAVPGHGVGPSIDGAHPGARAAR
jgi:hypothetical protein